MPKTVSYEKSCGALVIRRDSEDGQYYILTIRHRPGGYRSFPKGHVEAGETERATALREVAEETSVLITILPDFRHAVCYEPSPGVQKEVVYFLASTEQKETRPQRGEVAQVEWIPLLEAEKYLTHENDKYVWSAALQKLRATMDNL